MKTKVKIDFYKDYRSNVRIGAVDKNGERYSFFVDCDFISKKMEKRKAVVSYLRGKYPQFRIIATYDYND